MYLINPLANGVKEISAEEFEKYFPNLKDGATFHIEKRGEDYYIETTLDVEDLKKEILAFHEKEKEEKIKLAEKTQKKTINHFEQLKIPGFDEEKSFQEKTIEEVLKRGSGFENGKFRIVKAYESGVGNFANFLKDEYGLGGASYDGLYYHSNASGLNIKYDNIENESNNFKTLLKWEQVAKRISQLIDSQEYFTSKEIGKYEVWLTSQDKSTQNVSEYYKNYLSYQEKYPDKVVVMRLGDFYEVLGENAMKVAEKLDLTLTGRNVGLKERIPMVGYPYHVADKYIEKLTNDYSIVVVDGEKVTEHLKIYEPTLLDDVEMEKRTIDQDAEESILQYEKEQKILRQDFPNDFENDFREALLDDLEEDLNYDIEKYQVNRVDNSMNEKLIKKIERDKNKEKHFKVIDSVTGGYAEPSYEWFVKVPNMNLYFSEKYNAYYIGESLNSINRNNFIFDKELASQEFSIVKSYIYSEEHAKESDLKNYSIEELKKWQEKNGFNKYVGKSIIYDTSQYLLTELEKKEKSTQVKPSLDLNNKNKKEKQMNNSVKLQGKLVEKPEIKTSEKGTIWTSVVLEVEQQYADKSRINNFKVTFFGEQAEKLAQMEKGDTLSVKGRLNSTTYNNKTSLQVIGNVAEQDEKVSKNAVQLSGFIQNKNLDIKTSENGNKYLNLALSVKSDSDKTQEEYQTLFVNAFGKCAERIAENYTRYDLIKIDGALELNGERLSVVAHRSELIKSGKEIISAGKTQNENVKEDGQAPKQSTNDKI